MSRYDSYDNKGSKGSRDRQRSGSGRSAGRGDKARPFSTRKNERRTDLKRPAGKAGTKAAQGGRRGAPQGAGASGRGYDGGRRDTRGSKDGYRDARGYETGAAGSAIRQTAYGEAAGSTGQGAAVRSGAGPKPGAEGPAENLLTGRNPVMEALRSGRGIDRILLASGAEGSARKIAGMARDSGVRVQYVERTVLDRIAGGKNHQGVVAVVSDFAYCEVEDILAAAKARAEDPFIVVLDGIEDPHNLGAIIRTADAAGAHGVVIPVNRAASVTAVAEKSAAGAASYVPVARVTNLAQAVDQLKEAGVWVAAVDMDGGPLWETALQGPVAIVIGNEGKGISRLIREKCDLAVSIPMRGGVSSLNASNAAAVLLYEILRQRTTQE